jgi:hypothetical protein
MQKFIDATIKPVLIIGGLGTAAAGLYAFFPQFAVENIAELEFDGNYAIIVQHWGMMVGLFGAMMVAAAFQESWRTPILLYGLIEKAFMVFLVVSNLGQPFASGFYAPAVMDALITAWLIVYFASLRQKS